jgi:F-type H+-transporting ATPase subunit epsilon
MNTLQAHILTPDGPVFEGEIKSIRLPGAEGDFQVLQQHASLIASLTIGPVNIVQPDGKSQKFAISGGLVEVNQNQVTLFAEAAEHREKINLDRARAAKERAEQRLKENQYDQVRAEAALRRAINRLKIAQR